MGQNSVRRNLFHRNLSRRPATEDEENPIKSHPTSKSRVPLKTPSSLPSVLDKAQQAEKQAEKRAAELESREIAVHDKHGNYLFDRAPPLPPSFIEWEESQIEAEAEKKAYLAPFKREGKLASDRKDEAHEKGEPEELVRCIKESLVREVESLAEDNWMYEPEHDPVV
ncbi:hypothetical protein N7495_002997 [Penicillium taxi]|uniref:uncharacterized protein n=1 Tax=Penicillium taxi TaxID=168475 RepID=UPI002545855F|nr:uncharacterized protein N7495_002997 [Penicillium taxi]KAJ5902469.1 hypothetical protein N7495_002997 [Penicillium taxi]